MKKIIMFLVIVFAVLAAAGCGGGDKTDKNTRNADGTIKKPSSPLRYSLGTGASGGNFYLVGGGLATVLNNSLGDFFTITAEETGGSTANLTMIQNGDAEIGISMTSSLAEGAAGAKWTGGKPLDKIRGMVALYPSYMTIYALQSSNIKKLQDLNGKVVGLGSKGAAMDSVLRKAFNKMDIKPKSIFNDGHGATASVVSDGQVDVAVLFSYPPFPSIAELEASKGLDFIGLTDREQKQLTDMFPFYKASIMPKGSYKGATTDVKTVSEWNMLVVGKDVQDDYVYLLTKTILENNPDLLEIHKSLKYVTAQNILNYNVPLHPGTIKYLKEKGIKVPANLIPPEYKA
ncbi:MAG: TAXI family TRAP transporter solute-binding subunit [Acidaminococcaceae bacterium]|nr:TAXI family TRAP transporter solute-binding subunit [Acidaminococcaceae bacterium]